MRILEVSPYPLDVPGGVQRQVHGLATHLRQVGHNVDILAPSARPNRKGSFTVQWNGATAHLGAMVRSTAALNPAAICRYDVVHVHEPLLPFSLAVIGFARKRRLVFTCHADNEARYLVLAQGLSKRLNRIVAVSVASSYRAALTAYRAGIVVNQIIPIGIDVEPIPARKCPRGPFVLFVGRHDRRKGLRDFLAALDLLPSVVGVVVGYGPESKHLRRSFRWSNVIWLGNVSDEELWELYSSAAAMVAPATGSESFGVVLLEAMRAHLPIVASDVPGYREALGEPPAALLTPPSSPARLAEGIQRVLNHLEVRQELVARGDSRVARFSMRNAAQLYEHIMKNGAFESLANGLGADASVYPSHSAYRPGTAAAAEDRYRMYR